MTRARNRTQGLGNPPLIQLLLEAVLCVFVSLVQGAATTLGMIFKRTSRDWHTAIAHEDLPQATSGIQFQDNNHTHGVILGLVPRIPVGTPWGLSIDPHEAINQDARHKAERDSADVAATRTSAPPPNGGGAPRTEPATSGLRWGTALAIRTVRTRRTTVPHLTRTRCVHLARFSSPVRGRIMSAHA